MRRKGLGKSDLVVLHLAGDMKDAGSQGTLVEKEGYVIQNGWTEGLIMDESFPWLTFENHRRGFLSLRAQGVRTIGPALTFICRFRARGGGFSTLCSGNGFEFAIHGSDAVYRGAGPDLILGGVREGSWQSAAFSFDPGTGRRSIWVDGNLASAPALGTASPAAPRIRIGRGLSDSSETQFEGDIEEVRVMDRALPAAWLKAMATDLGNSDSWVKIKDLEEFGATFARPSPPRLSNPADASQSYRPHGAKLAWRPSIGASEYDVLLFSSPRGERPWRTIPAGAATTIDLTAAMAGRAEVYWAVSAKSAHGEARSGQTYRLTFCSGNTRDQVAPSSRAVGPELMRPDNLTIELAGYLGRRIDRIAHYLIDFDERNPGLLRMLRDRPEKGVPSWAGVFAGQYLSSAELVWRLTRNPVLKAHIDGYVRELIRTQRADGYLGPFENLSGSLELWNHYATLTGLLDYYEDAGDQPALDAARRIVDLVINTYGPAGATVPKEGGADEAISHAVARLYRDTGDPRYLNLVNYFIHEVWDEPGGVALYRLGLEDAAVSRFPVRRWESVHTIMALSEMYWSTGDPAYREGFENLWRTLRKTERHNTGGFSTNEGLLGTPYHHGTIETCCTVAWSLLSTDMLRISGESRAADELEWSACNSALAAIPYDGTCSTYDNPADGRRSYNVLHQGPFDGRELSCCSTNADRALGNIANWALLRRPDGLVLNYYGPSKISADLPSGNRLTLEQVTSYPAGAEIELKVSMRSPEVTTLWLRIPGWSAQTRVRLNGKLLDAPPAGSYLPIRRRWNAGDQVELSLDLTPRFLIGREDYAGKISILRGPILLAAAARYDRAYHDHPFPLDPEEIRIELDETKPENEPWLLARITAGGGRRLEACDFASAGLFGDAFQSWFSIPDRRPKP